MVEIDKSLLSFDFEVSGKLQGV